MKQVLITFVLSLCVNFLFAQVSINTDNSHPDASAMLDVKSTEKGMLVPRMSSTQRQAIASPATGLLVFDSTTATFWFYGGAAWVELTDTDTDTDTQLSEAEVDVFVSNNGYLIAEVDGDINNEIQDLELSANTLSLSDDATTVDLSGYLDNTDDQTLTLSGDDLTIQDGNTVDLSSLRDNAIIADADNDTKIQVEESADEDKIRFDLDGTEQFRFEDGRIHTQNNGISVFLGQNAGTNDDQTNNENVYIGYLTGRFNENASACVGIGRAAQENHTSGNFTVAIGNYCMQKHESGSNNIAIGGYAMNSNVDGTDNTALGTGALRFDTTGNNNVAIGAYSLYNGTGIANNTALGHYSGYNATGSSNVFLGRNAGRNSSESNTLYIDNSNTSSPLIFGEFDNNLIRVNGTLNSTGEISGDANLDIGTNALIGNMSLGSESTDQGTSVATGLGYTTTPWLYTNAVESQSERGSASTLITVGADGTYGSADQIHFVTSGNSQLMVNSSGLVGLDQSSPSTDFHIRQSQQSITGGTGGITFEESGDATDTWRIFHSGIYFSFNKGDDRVAYVTGTGAWTVDSDESFKKNINNMPSVLDRVKQLRPVKYHYKEQSDSEKKIPGFIAQELEPLFPELVVDGEDGKKGVTYGMMGPIALKAIQEQQEVIEGQKTEIEDLKATNANLLSRLERIEQELGLGIKE